jgi:hypothetical protein
MLPVNLKMNLKKVQIELDISDVQQVLRIALDEDKNKALEYIKGFIKRLEQQKQQGMKFHL